MNHINNRSRKYMIPDNHVFPFMAIYEPKLGREIDLIRQWFSLPLGSKLQMQNQDFVIILNHGIHNFNKGPDINDAVLFIYGKRVKGDVECHIKERDWYSHGHAYDVNYENVILHIIKETTLQNSPIPHTVILPNIKQWNCSLNDKNRVSDDRSLLKSLGALRWYDKVENCRKDQSYVELSIPLGCGGNEDNFKRLIHSIDLAVIIEIPFRKKIDYVNKIADHIKWEHCGIRPAQWPENRLQLLVELISFIEIINSIEFVQPDVFFKYLSRACPSGGRGILVECCINYFYPSFATLALKTNNAIEYKKWKRAWSELKLQNPYGRHVKRFGYLFSRKELCSVKIAQGLLQLEKEFCTPQYCMMCLLKQVKVNAVKN